MIGRLAGRIDYRAADHVLIDVRGVGYLVYCSERTLRALPGVGEHVALYTDLLVREDLLQLYGFNTLAEKEWHRLLMSVQGVGAKASLAILGTLGPDGVGRAIALGDWNAVKAAKGGEVQFKAVKGGIVHAGIGKASFDEEKLVENVRAFVTAVNKAKPAGAKGTYMKKISLSSTMGPGVSVAVESANAE